MPIEFKGLDITSPVNRLKAGFCLIALNVRRYLVGGFSLRNSLAGAIYTLAAAVRSIQRMNDTTPSGPVSGFTIISVDASGNLYNSGVLVATGLSGNPVSLVPFRPNQSVQPWMYLGDTSQSVTLPSSTGASLSPASVGTSLTWTNPANATSSTLFATYTGGILNSLDLTVSGLAIPLDATITGIGITLQVSISASNGQISFLPTFPGSIAETLPITTVPTTYSAGGRGYLWGTTVTPVLLNAGFAFVISAAGTANTISLNSFKITIYYSVPSSFSSFGMLKVRSDGLVRKMGIKEPQQAPIVGVNTTSVTQWLKLPANTPPWTNISGANPNYNYSGTDNQPPFPAIIATPVAGATVSLIVAGTATVNGSVHAPGDAGSTSPDFPGNFIAAAKIVVFAFTDADGNIIAQSAVFGAPPVVGNVGASAMLTVPANAAQLQIGINSQGGTFAANSGSYLVEAVVSTSAITTVASILGLINAYIWGDSPHSGPVATYIWKNPNDAGTGIARTIGTAQATSSNNSLIMDSTPEDGTVPVIWSTLDSSGATIGSINLFSPALESEGYQDFNVCVVGSLWIPEAGTYAIQLQYKDQIMFGIGGGATSTGGAVFGPMGQAITVVNGFPLLFVSAIDGLGGNHTTSINVTFAAPGVYQFEGDWVYWFHTGRVFIIEMAPTPGASVALIPPLPQSVRTGVQYWYKYRASETGAQSNPGPASPIELTPVLANTVLSAWSNDPQVTKVDYYRQDDALINPTYVATGPNDGLGGTINGVLYNTAIEDTLDDLAAAGNPEMQVDDFEPFPSIDTPKSGMVSIIGGVINWVSGDQFNTRWLAGTLILIGAPTQNAYSLIARPLSATQMVIPDVPDTIGDAGGNGVPYNIAQPILANQPLPYLFGPTDNIPFTCGVGDPGRPGTIYWSKGNNLDSAPDTNQQDLTDPSEALVNGAMSGGYAIVFSIRRAWVMEPNFYTAEATATGTAGSTWSFRSTDISRGLFIPRCLAVEGSGKTFFRVDDGWHFSQSGQGSVSITDETLYPLFPHEGSTPAAITRNGITIYPPDDTLPQLQQANIQGPYMYWTYQGIDGNPYTLVFDINMMGWIFNPTNPPATTYSSNQGLSTQGVLVGCSDGTIQELSSSGGEVVTGTVLTPAMGGRGFQHCGELVIEYSSTQAIAFTGVVQDDNNDSYGPLPMTLPGTAGKTTKYFFRPSPNKWKLLSWQFQFTDPTVQIYLDGCIAYTRSWGSEEAYLPTPMFGEAGGAG